MGTQGTVVVVLGWCGSFWGWQGVVVVELILVMVNSDSGGQQRWWGRASWGSGGWWGCMVGDDGGAIGLIVMENLWSLIEECDWAIKATQLGQRSQVRLTLPARAGEPNPRWEALFQVKGKLCNVKLVILVKRIEAQCPQDYSENFLAKNRWRREAIPMHTVSLLSSNQPHVLKLLPLPVFPVTPSHFRPYLAHNDTQFPLLLSL